MQTSPAPGSGPSVLSAECLLTSIQAPSWPGGAWGHSPWRGPCAAVGLTALFSPLTGLLTNAGGASAARSAPAGATPSFHRGPTRPPPDTPRLPRADSLHRPRPSELIRAAAPRSWHGTPRGGPASLGARPSRPPRPEEDQDRTRTRTGRGRGRGQGRGAETAEGCGRAGQGEECGAGRGAPAGRRSGLSRRPGLAESLLFSYPFSIYSIDQRANLF